MEVNSRRPSRPLFADYVSDAPPLFSSQGNEQGIQACSPGNVGNDLYSTLTRSCSLVAKGNPGTPRGSVNSLVGFGRRKLRSWHCQMIMAFSMGVVLTFMFAHYPQSPLPGNDARAAVAHGYQMTVNPANERQLASESQPVMRRQNAEMHGGIFHDWGPEQAVLTASRVNSRLGAEAALPGRNSIPQGPEQDVDWRGVDISGVGQQESSQRSTQDLPEDMEKASLEVESRLSASDLSDGTTSEKANDNAASDHTDADRALAQPAVSKARSRAGAKEHRKAKMSGHGSQRNFGSGANAASSGANAASPAVKFAPAPHGKSQPVSSSEQTQRRSAEQASVVETSTKQAANKESSSAVKRTSSEVTEQSESTTIAGQEGFTISSAVLDEILNGNDHEAFVDVLLEAASLEEDEVGSEKTVQDFLENEASQSSGGDVLESILGGSRQEVHSKIDVFKQLKTAADGFQGLDLEPEAEPKASAAGPRSEIAVNQLHSGGDPVGGESTGVKAAVEEPQAKGSADSSHRNDKPAEQQPKSAVEWNSEGSLGEANLEAQPELLSTEGSESHELGGVDKEPAAGALEIVFDIDDDGGIQQWQDRAAKERQLQESERFLEASKATHKAEEDAAVGEKAEQEHLEAEREVKEEAERKAKEEAERTELERAQELQRAAKEAALMVAISKAEDAYLKHLEESRPQLLVEIVEASAEVAKEQAKASRKRLEGTQAAEQQSSESEQEVATEKPVGGMSVDDAVALLDTAHAKVLLEYARAQADAAAVYDPDQLS